MFLASKELKYSKMKFSLIIAVIVLISYLVYFLTSLAYGLASSYTNAINEWDSTHIIMTTDANDNMMMSYMTQADFESVSVEGKKTKLGLFPAVITNPLVSDDVDSRINVYFFGIEDDSYIKPKNNLLVELYDNHVIVDEELKNEGYKIDDTFVVSTTSGTTKEFVIKGFSANTTYQTAPVVYMNLTTWQEYRYDSNTPPNIYSGIIVSGEVNSFGSNLSNYLTKDFINTLPGYTAQVLTFSTMIIFLIIIVAFVLGIFIYVLTIQKTNMFGVMKAQGISNGYIGLSVVAQTFLLVAIGLIIGLILTAISGLFLGQTIPFAFNPLFYIVITIAFFIFALFGALFSVKAVLKIDPLKAIGA